MNHTILLVDDEDSILDLFDSYLGDGYQTLTTTSPEQALKIVTEKPEIQVVVTDLQMPDLNGIDLLKKIHSLNKDIIRTIVSGNSDLDKTQQAIDDGHVDFFLTKPCSPKDLRGVVEKCLQIYNEKTAK